MPIGPFNNETGKTVFVPIEGTMSLTSRYVISEETASTAMQAITLTISILRSLGMDDSFMGQRFTRALMELEAKHADQL
jgi:hypothetical protein